MEKVARQEGLVIDGAPEEVLVSENLPAQEQELEVVESITVDPREIMLRGLMESVRLGGATGEMAAKLYNKAFPKEKPLYPNQFGQSQKPIR